MHPNGPSKHRLQVWLSVVALFLGMLALPSTPAQTVVPVAQPLQGANVDLTLFCMNDPAVNAWSRKTIESNSNDVGNPGSLIDVWLGNNVANNAYPRVFLGADQPFDKAVFDLTVPGTLGTVVFKYWKGSPQGGSWVALSNVGGNFNNFQGPPLEGPPPDLYYAHWPVPNDWSKTSLGGNCAKECTACSTIELYYALIETDVLYGDYPQAAQISVRMPNLQLKVSTEAGIPVTGLAQGKFTVANGTRANVGILSFKEVLTRPGEYQLALYGGRASGDDTNFTIKVSPDDYVENQVWYTKELGKSLHDETARPIALRYTLKVVLKDDSNAPVAGAIVKLNSTPPSAVVDNTYYFAGTAGGPLSASVAGYEALDPKVDTKLQNINQAPNKRSVITLGGTAACSGGSSVSAGTATVQCRGLKKITGGGSSGGGSSPSSSRTPGSSGSSGPGSSAVISSQAAEAKRIVAGEMLRPDGEYRASISHVDKDTVLEIDLRAQNDPVIDSVTLTFTEAADNVVVVAERSQRLDSALGVPLPGGTIFGYIIVKVYVDDVLSENLVETTTIYFSVDQKTLDHWAQAPTGVDLLRHNGAEWKVLHTVPLGRQGEQFAFSAQGPGAGVFSIYGDSTQPVETGFPWGAIALGVFLVNLAVGAVLYARREKLNPKDVFP